MTALTLDPSRSELRVRTGAEGLLGALAHSLELVGDALQGTLDGERATVTLATDALRVDGAVRHGAVDPAVLSPQDRAEITRRLRQEVFAGGGALTLTLRREAGALRGELRTPRGAQAVTVRATERQEASGARVFQGALTASLRALGVPALRGPLGAFRVADALQARFTAVFVPPGG
ncbi:MAG: hypothetical protein HY909_04755 [Deltaproteobacteria bacterium]|nr:hypothetical protein [Deltaproteobacteria bacterium]